MKKVILINIILLSFFLPIVISSCQDSHAKKDEMKNTELSSVEKQNITGKEATTENESKNDITRWNTDAAKAQITFVVKGPFGKVHGKLSGLTSIIRFDENNPAASSIQARVDPKTISTGIKLRNRDLQKEKYLDTDNHPLVSFHSEKIQKHGAGYTAIGNLTLKGITKRVEIPFNFIEKGNSGVFKGSFTIQRQNFGVGKKGGSIGNDVVITLEVPATKSK